MHEVIGGGTTPYIDPLRYVREADEMRAAAEEARDNPGLRRTLLKLARDLEQVALRALREQMVSQ